MRAAGGEAVELVESLAARLLRAAPVTGKHGP
jgi:hypothetical protein